MSAPARAPAAPGTASLPAARVDDGCGPGCTLFDSPRDAFARVLADAPVVLAVGEAHAQRGTPGVASATKRFTTELLPELAGKSSDLLLELWFANPKCSKQKVKQVAKRQEAVTRPQADTNQNEFIALGDAAKALGIQPHVLTPACKEYDAILRAGPDDVASMLEMIARLTRRDVELLLERRRKSGSESIIVAYGGAMHNDLHPRPGFESFTFGPAASELTAGRAIELDLIVPEYIKDTPSWRALPWYARYAPTLHPDRTWLIESSKGSYALIFPRSAAPAGSAPAP
ncbi:MAG: hypothetical protein OZ948_01180 [Deltaproteobacteria bacterium]|nr:hypothetical protein [Deltaproteobacteria bacterium]